MRSPSTLFSFRRQPRLQVSLVVVVAAVALLASLPTSLAADVTLAEPVAAQLPLVARVGEAYTWSPRPTTFNASSSSSVVVTDLNYTASGLPSWLTFDDATLGLTGTPDASDVGLTSAITLTADAGPGETATDTFSLYVSDTSAPVIHLGLGTQTADPSLHAFSSVQILPSHAGVSVRQGYSFSLGFQQDTFRSSTDGGYGPVYYVARERGQIGLPSWLTFDNDTVTFDGVAPYNGAGSTYVISLVGSDVWGFSAIESSIVIEIVSTADSSVLTLDLERGAFGFGNVTTVAGANVSYPLELDLLRLDGEALSSSQMQQLVVQPDTSQVPWLSYDSSTATLSGMAPSTYLNGTASPLLIPLQFSLDNTATSSTASFESFLPVTIVPSAFTAIDLPAANATAGQAFSFNLKPYLRDPASVSGVNASFTPVSSNWTSWLSFDAQQLTLSGTLPSVNSSSRRRRSLLAAAAASNGDAHVSVQFQALGSTSTIASVANLAIDLNGYAAPPGSGASGVPSSTATSSKGDGGSEGNHGLSTAGKIALGVVFGLLGLILLCILLFCCCRRHRRNRDQSGDNGRPRKSGESFVAAIKSPRATHDEKSGPLPFGMPRSESARLQRGETPQFQHLYVHRPSDVSGQGSPMSFDAAAAANTGTFENSSSHGPASPPRRLGAMRGILSWGAFSSDHHRPKSQTTEGEAAAVAAAVPPLSPTSPVPGEIIRQGTPHGAPSDFSHSFASSDSRASWESPESYHWSSGDGHQQRFDADGRPLSGTASIPRPRADFTPRYPRNASPTAAAVGRLAFSGSDRLSHHTFSEFHGSGSGSGGSQTHTGSHSTSLGTGSHSHSSEAAPAGFTHGPSALGRIIGENEHPHESDEERATSDEGSIVEAHAHRQSMDRQVRIMPSRGRLAQQSPTHDEFGEAVHKTPSEEAIAVVDEAAFDDAEEEARRSMAYAPTEIGGLGFPSEAIYFGSPPPQRAGGQRISSIRAVPPPAESVQSPPLPQLNLVQQLAANRRSAVSANSVLHDGRYLAQANENFNLHPHINPPPVVTLSASTWSSAPPSTYRAEGIDGQPLPKWLHWDTKELELWGIPSLADAGQVIEVRIIERMPKEKRRSYDSSQYIPNEQTEREVGSVVVE